MGTFGAERIEHVTIIVTNMKRSRDFYERVLELKEVPRPESFDFPGAWYQIGPTFLHLMEKPQQDSASARHFCLWVSDIQTAAEHATTSGCEVKWQLNHKIPGVDRFFVYDPDGNRIEIQGSDKN
jgi:catechol 2,3-dioxygenase-like lactoylglutathione lyase family enzyme